jgi:hypothetical protein
VAWRGVAWRKPPSARPRESGAQPLDSQQKRVYARLRRAMRGNERKSEATVERREASVPRHKRVHALWHTARVFRRVGEARLQTPGANAPRERDGLFDIVRYERKRDARYSALSPRGRGQLGVATRDDG